ncbi:MAG: flagellar protein FlgN, partial [Gammaproteobacteria bacterium]|nr:flagellar protein FlgN [Gammaproteobacteria bacterium]
MDWQVFTATLIDLIDRELVLAHELGDALANERDALRSVDPVALDTATARKQLCVENLSRLDTERQAMCVSLGVSPDRDGMERLLMQADPQGKLSQRWQTLLTRLETCREANHKNGAVARLQKRRV